MSRNRLAHGPRAVLVLVAGLFALPGHGADVVVHENMAYKAGNRLSDYERERCALDLYLPADARDFPVIVWFHGGGITAGDKAEDTQAGIARTFAAHGVAVASVNYRLSPKVSFPGYVDDAAASVAWVLDHIEDYAGDASKVYVSGHSAGAYLAAMVGLDPQYLGAYDHAPADLAGLMPISGQMVTHATVRAERGLPENRPIIDAAAPIYHVSSDAPPFLAMAGSDDLPARPEENRYFVAAMKAVGHADVSYLEFEGRNHGSIVTGIPNAQDPVAEAMLAFIARTAN